MKMDVPFEQPVADMSWRKAYSEGLPVKLAARSNVDESLQNDYPKKQSLDSVPRQSKCGSLIRHLSSRTSFLHNVLPTKQSLAVCTLNLTLDLQI